MANRQEVALMAHLMRRAGFGASRDELECLVGEGYESAVEGLINVEFLPAVDTYMLYRHQPTTEIPAQHYTGGQANWLYHMITTERPLEEKMALFWHHVFATGNGKVDNCDNMIVQIQMFRDYGMGNYRDLIIELAKNPAMIYWLDNNENHKHAPNENWGRELLELFSLGVGNYTEKDVFECSRAFTGWTLSAKVPRYPYGRFPWKFEYRSEDHDYTEKTFLGRTGDFNGEDIIDIILEQPACAKFIARHLYNFFVADEPQVPAWDIEPPQDAEAVQFLADVFVESSFEIKPVLRALFNSDFFKESAYQKVRNPVEIVASTLKLTGDIVGPDPRIEITSKEPGYMGQDFLEPPSVEGWHTGKEWINSGSLVKRINFVADRVGNVELPGIQDIVRRVAGEDKAMTAEVLIDRCLDHMGPLELTERSHKELLDQVETDGPISYDTEKSYAAFAQRVGSTLALIASTREYQFG